MVAISILRFTPQVGSKLQDIHPIESPPRVYTRRRNKERDDLLAALRVIQEKSLHFEVHER